MNVYLYLDRDTPVHRLDPRPKLFLLLAVILLAVAADHPLIPGALFALVLLAAHVARAWPSLRRVRVLLLTIGLFSTVTWSLFARGETRLLGPLTLEALLFGIATGLKLVSTIAASVVFFSTTRNEELAVALIRLRLSYPVAFAFSTALRLVPTFVGAGMTIVQAQRSRGLDLDSGGLLTRLRRHLPLLVPIIATALRSVNHLSMALEAKGFGARRERTYYLQLQLRAADWLALLLALAGILTAVLLRLSGAGRIPGLSR